MSIAPTSSSCPTLIFGLLTFRSNPIRANQSFKLDPLDPTVPRSIPPFPRKRSGFPPPPSVEDEAESLAKEHAGSVVSVADEEPKFRGDLDQQPIILAVPEHNSERRYVILTPSETDEDSVSDGSQAGQEQDLPQRREYTANTKIQLDPKANSDAPSGPQRRKSRAELPKIETHVPSPRPRRPSYVQRSSSATCVDQKSQDTRDYFSSHPESARPAGDAFLSPVIKHATKGRDRAYWNFNPGANGTSPRNSAADIKPSSGDRKGCDGYARTSYSASPVAPRRTNSALEIPREARRTAERSSSYRDETSSRTKRSGPPTPPLDQRPSRSRSRRREHSPARSHRELLKLSRRKSTHRSRHSSPREADIGNSSDEHRDTKSHRSHRHRGKSTVVQDDRLPLLSPGLASTRSKSRPPSPLPSPRSAHARSPDYGLEANPRSSTSAFNVARDKRRNEIERPISPLSSGSSTSSPRSRSRRRADRSVHGSRRRAPSRSPSIRSVASTTISMDSPAFEYGSTPLPMVVPTYERKRQTMPPSPAYSRQNSLEEVHRSSRHRQLEPLLPTPRQSKTSLQQSLSPIVSFRRFSEDVSTGSKTGLPDCPRQRPRAGYSDWLTLPRSEKFHICPTCYEQVFRPTGFRDLFIPAPVRSREKEIACDFGTSPWYRAAWLMTCKRQQSNLRLLQGIADVFAREKTPCSGNLRVPRTWYSITDPNTRRCIPDFNVCGPCARAVEVLFPNMVGIFVPQDRPAEPKSGKCSLHFAPNRKRFMTYFDVFEKCHDQAVEERSAPDSKRLAYNINFWSDVGECPENQDLRHEFWYIMADIPEMTACEECFLDVVYPELVAEVEARAAAGGEDKMKSVASNFYHQPLLVKKATMCQMADPWMRQLFRTACRRGYGVWYMDAKVRERLDSSK